MVIRNFVLNDYEEVYQLWRNTPGMGLNDIDDSKDGIQKYLLRNPTTCFVAVEDQKIVGVILSGHDGRRGMIHHTAVAAYAQHRGIGEALVKRVISALRAEGIHKVLLVVFDKNETGNAFWEKQGFSKRTDLIYRNRAISE